MRLKPGVWFSLVVSTATGVLGGGGSWSYSGHTGPDHWPAPCLTGKSQSPVDLPECGSELMQAPDWTFTSFEVPYFVDISNNGHTAKLAFRSNAITSEGGGFPQPFIFAQAHFHWGSENGVGSEHLIGGKQFPLEVHLVHYNSKYSDISAAIANPDGLAVLGSMFHVSAEDNKNLNPVIDGLQTIQDHSNDTKLRSTFALNNLLPADVTRFYRYTGSLTTPGCSEVVLWTVFQESIPISTAQLQEFRKLINSHGDSLSDNFRPVQPLNGRKVLTTSYPQHCNSINKELKVEVGMAGLSNSLVALLGLIALFGIPLMQAAVNRTEVEIVRYVSCLLTGVLAFWATGYAFTKGKSAAGFIGTQHFFSTDVPEGGIQGFLCELGYPLSVCFLVLSSTPGKVSARFSCTLTFLVTGLFYPVLAHWTSNSQGWLVERGYADPAGGGQPVHLYVAASTIVLLRCIKAKSSPSSTSPVSVMLEIGSFLYIFSIVTQNLFKSSQTGSVTGSVLNTLLAMVAGATVPVLLALIRKHKGGRDRIEWTNSILVAVVAVRSGSCCIPGWAAVITGLAASALYIPAAKLTYRFGLCDGLQVVAVHGVGGLLAHIIPPLLRWDDQGIIYSGSVEAARSLGWNLVGCLLTLVYGSVLTLILVLPFQNLGLVAKSKKLETNGVHETSEIQPLK